MSPPKPISRSVARARPQGPKGDSGTKRFSLPFLPALDGIRGLSVFSIMGFHAHFAWASGAYFSLSTFFTLSGYLITSLLLAEHEATGRIDLARFWGRRFRRLMPGALVALLGIALYGVFIADPSQLQRLRGDGIAALFYVANWRFLWTGQSYTALFSEPSPALHFWSLSIEEQYYIFYPLVFAAVIAVGRGSRRTLFGVLFLLAASSAGLMIVLWEPGMDTSRVYYGTDTRACELLVGGLLAILLPPAAALVEVARRVLAAAGCAAAILIAVIWTTAAEGSDWVLEGGLPAYSLVTALLVAGAVQPGPLKAALSFAPFRWLGRVSYGVYLFHWPLFLVISPERTGLDPWPLFALRLAIILPLAELSNRFIELPIRYARNLPNVSSAIAGGVAAAVVVGAFVGATWNPPRPVIDLNALERQSALTMRPEVDERPLVVLFGDSVTYSLFHGLRKWGDETGTFRVGHQAKFQCGVARGGEQLLSSGVRNSETRCPVKLRKWRRVMRNYEASLAIVGSSVMDLADRRLAEWSEFKSPGNTEFDDFVISQYEHVADLVSASGAKVAWLNVPCMLDESIPGPLAGSPAISTERIGYLNEIILPRLARSRPAVGMIDIHSPLCGAAPENDTLRAPELRPDGMHFSEEGSFQMARWLGPQIVALLRDGTPTRDPKVAPSGMD